METSSSKSNGLREIIVTFTNVEIAFLWVENEHWQRALNDFWGEINNRYPQNKRF